MEELITGDPHKYQYSIKMAEIIYSSAVASSNNMAMLELSRKYFTHSLVLIDENKSNVINNNVVRALWGLMKTCKSIQK